MTYCYILLYIYIYIFFLLPAWRHSQTSGGSGTMALYMIMKIILLCRIVLYYVLLHYIILWYTIYYDAPGSWSRSCRWLWRSRRVPDAGPGGSGGASIYLSIYRYLSITYWYSYVYIYIYMYMYVYIYIYMYIHVYVTCLSWWRRRRLSCSRRALAAWKREVDASQGFPCVTEFSYVAIRCPRPGSGILTPFPFERRLLLAVGAVPLVRRLPPLPTLGRSCSVPVCWLSRYILAWS